MFPESDLLPISALQHLAFCERQWALIHVEQIWRENRLTVEGRHLHERVDAPGQQSRPGLRITRSLRLRSLRLGLTGIADVVEFRRCEEAVADRPIAASDPQSPTAVAPAHHRCGSNTEGKGDADCRTLAPSDTLGLGIVLSDVAGLWVPFPVEYKRGKPKKNHCDEVQLCAQALCLEEMLETRVPDGALFYGRNRRRTPVEFDDALRAETEVLTQRLHTLYRTARTPPAKYAKKCDRCSLFSVCMPKTMDGHRSARSYLDQAIRCSRSEPPESPL